MPLGLDTLDFTVLVALIVALTIYLKKDQILEFLQGESDDPSFSVSNDTRDLKEIIQQNKKNFLVLYGSQTGTAEDYAKKFSKELNSKFANQINVMCGDIENYDFDNFNEVCTETDVKIVAFFISTYGEGDYPDSCVHFEDYLNSLEEQSLVDTKFMLFGLGNSTYEFFNGAAKKCLDKLTQDGGASLLGEYGQADDGTGTTDDDYVNWKENILEVLKSELSLDEKEQVFKPSFEYLKISDDLVEISAQDGKHVSFGEPAKQYLPGSELSFNNDGKQLGPFDAQHPYIAPVVKTKELCSEDSGRSCVHLEFDVSGSNMKYSTGDHLGVWPSNSNEHVAKFISTFKLNPNETFDLKPLDSTIKLPFVTPTTIESCVRNYLEITGPISRQLFQSLTQFIPSTHADLKNKITELSKNSDLFHQEITSKYYNFSDSLIALDSSFDWSIIPWTFLLENITHLQPRYYSISSSASMEKQTIHVTAMVESFENPVNNSEQVTGVTTNLFKNIEIEQNNTSGKLPVHYDLSGPRSLFKNFKLPVHVRKSQFRLPSNPSTPVIMIGPGTGVAPFRGFVRERVQVLAKQKSTTNNKFGKSLLFYGCRNEGDFLYEDEWAEYSKKLGDSFEMFVALSRSTKCKKTYVQDKLMENNEQILELLNQGAFIYICGDAKHMAKGVHDTLCNILATGKGISNEDASEMLKMMKVAGKYQEDVW